MDSSDKTYCKYFNKKNVKIVPFELLKTEKEKFINEINDFLELDGQLFFPKVSSQNRAYSIFSARIGAVLNRLFIWFDLPWKIIENIYIVLYKKLRLLINKEPALFFRKKYELSKNQIEKLLWFLLSKTLSMMTILCKPPGRSKNFILNKIDNYLIKINKYKKASYLTVEQRELILELHSETNKNLSDKAGLDLAKYGYYKVRK